MADDRQGSGFGGNSLILLVVAAASAVYMAWQKPPLEGSRPTEAGPQIQYGGGAQNVDARMWQDPLAAVTEHLRAAQSDKPNASGLPDQNKFHQISELLNGSEGQETLVIGVTLPGAPYEEDAEERRRLRYAVLAALHTENYAPADEEHIGYLETDDSKETGREPRPGIVVASSADVPVEPRRSTNKKDDSPPLPPIVPFEWFNSTREPEKRVAVLWLNESFLANGRRPIGSLLHLRNRLQHSGKAKFALIGPHDSTTLTAMAREVAPLKNSDQSTSASDDRHSRLSVYNFAATADDRTVSRLARSRAGSLADYFETRGIDYYRTVSSDVALAMALVKELKRQNVDLYHAARSGDHGKVTETQDRRDHIALISEWDTIYGQSLPEAVVSAFARNASSDTANTSDAASRIMHFGYLRGLDGRLPGTRAAKAGKSSADEEASHKTENSSGATVSNTTGQLERAAGQSQFDYLRRLADQVRQRDDELRQKGEGRIAAIGVLGSDVYDKLLILQALRPELPEALFFTTDLDAVLLPQGKFEYTRNLIVASSYDLKLRDSLQADIPPFRSTYQTSIFLTTRLAVENESANAGARPAKDKARVADWLAQPRMFQIGRTGAYPLPVSSDDYRRNFSEDEEHSCAVNIVECPSVQPSAKKLFSEIRSGSLISTSLLAASVAIAVPMGSRRFRRIFFPGKSSGVAPRLVPPRLVPLTILLLLALVGSASLCVYWPRIADWLTEYGLGEPMSLFEGISVWPTILLRTVGLGFCIWLIFHTLQRLKANIRDTEKEMRLEKPRLRLLRRPGIRLRGRALGRRLTEMIAQVWFPKSLDSSNRSANESERPQLPIRHLSVRYRFEGRWPPRVTRAAIGTLAMFIVWLILAPIFGEPNVPARGSLARGIYCAVTMLDVIATLFLIFLVADATLYSRSFIKQLTVVRSKWPRQTVDYFAQTLGLRGENLDDWIDMQFLAKRTQCITSLIYYPFLMIALLLISRSRLFDNFTIPATLVITQLISVAVVIGSVFALRWAAEEARASAVEHLTAKIIAAKGAEQLDVKVASQLEMMLVRVENLRAGAFAPLSSQPFVKALLLPLLSYGGSMLAHLYALPGT